MPATERFRDDRCFAFLSILDRDFIVARVGKLGASKLLSQLLVLRKLDELVSFNIGLRFKVETNVGFLMISKFLFVF